MASVLALAEALGRLPEPSAGDRAAVASLVAAAPYAAAAQRLFDI